MKGTIYGIFNDENNSCYIGSTKKKYPSTRYSQHIKINIINPGRYGDLFNYKINKPYFKILDINEYDNIRELRKKETEFIKCYRLNPLLKCCNLNLAYLPDDEKYEAHKKAKRKYNITDKGKTYKKWANYRYFRKKQLLGELQAHIDNLDKRTSICPSYIKAN
jgi:hypothetical protein